MATNLINLKSTTTPDVEPDDIIVICDFCLKTEEQIAKMIWNQVLNAAICDECVDQCNQVIFRNLREPR